MASGLFDLNLVLPVFAPNPTPKEPKVIGPDETMLCELAQRWVCLALARVWRVMSWPLPPPRGLPLLTRPEGKAIRVGPG